MGKNQQKTGIDQPATDVVASSNGTSSRLPSLTRRNVKILAVVIVVAAVVLLLGIKLHNKQVQKQHASKAQELAVKGDYKNASTELIAAYNSEKDPAAKAGKAYNIALNYYYANDTTDGEKWMKTAEQEYLGLKQYEKAASAAEMRQRFAGLNSEAPAQGQNTGRDSAL